MSNRVFKGFKDDSSSQYLKKQINKETVSLTPGTGTNSDCFNFLFCSTLNIERYNKLKKLETFYNYKTQDENGNHYFNGEMNQANFLSSTINPSNTVVTQLINNLDNSMNLTLTTSTDINTNNENLFIVDPSGIFDTSCNNLFYIQNNDLSYNLQDLSGGVREITPKFKIDSEKNLCRLK